MTNYRVLLVVFVLVACQEAVGLQERCSNEPTQDSCPVVGASNGPATLFVAKHGSDDHSCSEASDPSTPKLTILAALDCLGSGPGEGATQVVEVAAGTYAESLFPPNGFPSGTSWEAPFTLRATAGEQVVIRPDSGGYAMYVSDGESGRPWYLIIQGFVFDGANVDFANVATVAIFASSVRMIGNEWINNGLCNALIGGRDNFEFLKNKIGGGRYNCGGGSGGDYGYPIYWGGNDSLFDGNELYDFPSFGFHIYKYTGCPSNNVIRNNVLHDFGWAATCPGGDPRCGDGPDDRGVGILACGADHQIYNNIVYNGTVGIHAYTGSGKRVENNTVYNMSIGGILSDHSDGNVVTANIVYNPESPRDGDLRSWQDPDTTTYDTNFCARSHAGCSIVGDPLFLDPANGDFNLQADSPAEGLGASPCQ